MFGNGGEPCYLEYEPEFQSLEQCREYKKLTPGIPAHAHIAQITLFL